MSLVSVVLASSTARLSTWALPLSGQTLAGVCVCDHVYECVCRARTLHWAPPTCSWSQHTKGLDKGGGEVSSTYCHPPTALHSLQFSPTYDDAHIQSCGSDSQRPDRHYRACNQGSPPNDHHHHHEASQPKLGALCTVDAAPCVTARSPPLRRPPCAASCTARAVLVQTNSEQHGHSRI